MEATLVRILPQGHETFIVPNHQGFAATSVLKCGPFNPFLLPSNGILNRVVVESSFDLCNGMDRGHFFVLVLVYTQSVSFLVFTHSVSFLVYTHAETPKPKSMADTLLKELGFNVSGTEDDSTSTLVLPTDFMNEEALSSSDDNSDVRRKRDRESAQRSRDLKKENEKRQKVEYDLIVNELVETEKDTLPQFMFHELPSELCFLASMSAKGNTQPLEKAMYESIFRKLAEISRIGGT